MDANSQQPKRRDATLSSLNAAVEALNLAGGRSSIASAKAVFRTVAVILTTIRVGFYSLGLRWSVGGLNAPRTQWSTR